ncbi:MAG TPA: SAM-dependent chlorinase/fluorinase [Planctomycetota bacterium]|nr:SAM-dependent chlorinase/fluorinase [Planctomycetota bacterium]
MARSRSLPRAGSDPGSPAPRPVFLLSDFGHQDGYVGTMKAVLRTLAPALTIDDLTHAVPPQDIAAGAFHLFTVLAYLPENALVVAVVDPGVGTGRAICVSRWSNRLFIAPDNGLLGAAFGWLAALHGVPPGASATRIEARVGGPTVTALLTDDGKHPLPAARPVSPWGRTFDGRDRFAPLAARLADPAAGAELLRKIGPWRDVPLAPQEDQLPTRTATGDWQGRIIHFDHFGNGITNLSLRNWLPERPFMTGTLGGGGLLGVKGSAPAWQVRWNNQVIPLVRTYAAAEDLPPPNHGPQIVALINSSDLLEIAIPGGSFQGWASAAHSARSAIDRSVHMLAAHR